MSINTKKYTGILGLRMAIVHQACADYAKQLKIFFKKSSSKYNIKNSKSEIISILKFFNSEYYMTLCDIDADCIINKLNKEIISELKEKNMLDINQLEQLELLDICNG